MKLFNQVIEASRTGENPRLNKLAATNVLRVIAEWLDSQGYSSPHRTKDSPGDALRNEIPKRG